ncbi:hypothetical protein CEXT_171691 [Caerostris extrusa]|uniref:Uncharacterized protein n=1 Tax=Caerostris extrusa TaxID=172846 RepID=A0AAV4QYZ2_CAEEX|nr:hypothetical protein CEXT_171691 [Caerostris extrusa]
MILSYYCGGSFCVLTHIEAYNKAIRSCSISRIGKPNSETCQTTIFVGVRSNRSKPLVFFKFEGSVREMILDSIVETGLEIKSLRFYGSDSTVLMQYNIMCHFS